MLLGFNTNCRHRGVLFHVQTEDSGVANPHVITHLFCGGNILTTQKRDYAEFLQRPDLESAVKSLMESLHRSVLDGLRQGLYDTSILERLGSDAFGVPEEGAETADSAATLPPFPLDSSEAEATDPQPPPPLPP